MLAYLPGPAQKAWASDDASLVEQGHTTGMQSSTACWYAALEHVHAASPPLEQPWYVPSMTLTTHRFCSHQLE